MLPAHLHERLEDVEREFFAAHGGRVLWGGCDPLFTPRPLGPLFEVADATGGELERLVASDGKPHEVAAALVAELAAPKGTVLVGIQNQGDLSVAGPLTLTAFASTDLTLDDSDPQVGEAFTLLTVPPGPDIAPYHNRQVALLDPPHWRAWLDGSARSVELLHPSGAGGLSVEAAA